MTADDTLTRVHREEWARIVGSLARRFGDLDVAEDAAAEAFAAAVERWPVDGVPPNPGGWLTVTAGRRALDRIRRESGRDGKHREAEMLRDDIPPEPIGAVDDDRLRLMFTCCHPALAPEARVALTLRMVGGLTVPEIARAFLVQERAMEQRITRAKGKIRRARIPYRLPSAADLPDRIEGVLAVLFLIFNEGYLSSGDAALPIRADLTAEAIRLARLLRGLLPRDGEVTGLLALMLLTEARRGARISADGALVPLDRQDRTRWSPELLREGRDLVVAHASAREPLGRYQLLAAIAAVHTADPGVDWAEVLALYDLLVAIDPSPVVRLNRAIALAEVRGATAGLTEVDELEDALQGYQPFHATRADLLRRTGAAADAGQAYDRAIALSGNAAERAALERMRDALWIRGRP